ncbi:MAG: hypothetical protein H7Y60_02250 [Rhodospirillaceae bacterium]|nr:hypothetical protein [Rhodospirillales bacterium]
MGYQFIHIETYGRRAKDSRDTAFVFAELRRDPAACTHVTVPRPPVVIFGRPVDDIEHEHDTRAAGARTRTASAKERAIRQDQHTAAVVVLSHPVTIESMEADLAVAADVAAWEKRSIAWLRRQFGDRLASVVRHEDEPHPHLHAVLLPDDSEMRAKLLHPGHAAKMTAAEAARAAGRSARDANRFGDKAYIDALRRWQDDYWEAVGLPCGLARIGPGRRRLSRGEWRREQAAMRAVKQAEHAADAIRQRLADDLAVLQASAAKVRAEARDMMMGTNAKAAAAQKSAKRAAAMADQAKRLQNQVAERAREIDAAARHQRTVGARIGLFLAGLVGFRHILESRHRREIAALEAKAATAHHTLEQSTKKTVDRIVHAAEQAKDDAARQKMEAEKAQAEVRRLRAELRKAGADRDLARVRLAKALPSDSCPEKKLG